MHRADDAKSSLVRDRQAPATAGKMPALRRLCRRLYRLPPACYIGTW